MAHNSIYIMALSGLALVTLLGCILGVDARIQGKTAGHGHHGGHGGYGYGHGHGHHRHHYNPCGNIYAGHEFCRHKHAGHYGHHNNKCYIQCDDWGRGFIRPCAKGTYWQGGKGPSKFNKCAGRNHHNRGYGGYGGYGGGYGARGYGGGYGGGGYGGGRYAFGGFGGYGGGY